MGDGFAGVLAAFGGEDFGVAGEVVINGDVARVF